MKSRCPICNSNLYKHFEIKERRIDSIDINFNYHLCDDCGTLYLVDDIEDMGFYYSAEPGGYYAYTENNKPKKLYDEDKEVYIYNAPSQQERSILRTTEWGVRYNSVLGTGISKTSAILDVGCGSGNWLDGLAEDGYQNLTGVDLFAPTNGQTKNWHYFRGEIFDIPNTSKYDLITMHSVIEHVNSPIETLVAAKGLLKEDGSIVVRTPVMGKAAWQQYGTDWCQLDAPRHINIMSREAWDIIARIIGMEIISTTYDGDRSHYFLSEGYRKTKNQYPKVILRDVIKMPIDDYNKYVLMAQNDNNNENGCQAIYLLKRCNSNNPESV